MAGWLWDREADRGRVDTELRHVRQETERLDVEMVVGLERLQEVEDLAADLEPKVSELETAVNR